jgi:transposase-like protein
LPGKYKTYSPEFRDEAARLVVETSRPIADVARELGISETSLGNWVRAYRESMPRMSRRCSYPSARGYASWNGKSASWRWKTPS